MLKITSIERKIEPTHKITNIKKTLVDNPFLVQMSLATFLTKARKCVVDTLLDMNPSKFRTIIEHDIHSIWVDYTPSDKRCIMWCEKMGNLYAEVNYNPDKSEFYVDIYSKEYHKKFNV